ncbi:hypothetical protein R3P38DRAFT_3309991 [Favolaschia claudopus]|uniref:mRNA 3'-end-processing protein RNA14 n=1 Tax=Favolaschia claudopus TaxID=2862362 RepID=A0AAW0CR61_9AGAR
MVGSDRRRDVADREFDGLKARLKACPKDPVTWKLLVAAAESSGDGDRIRQAYDALLRQYPNTASAQIALLNHTLNPCLSIAMDTEEVLGILGGSPSVDLWSFYLNVLQVPPVSRVTAHTSYARALRHIGYDIDSGSAIWAKYLQFLRSAPEDDQWNSQQKIQAVREAQAEAVKIPLDNLEQLWAELKCYENFLDSASAQKIIDNLFPAHKRALVVRDELRRHVQGLAKAKGSQISLPDVPTFSIEDRQLVGRWKSYLKWEEGNPMLDQKILVARVAHAYRKAVIEMRYYPEIWFMAYTWCDSVGNIAGARVFLQSGVEANPDSFALNYAYAELLEKVECQKDVNKRDFAGVTPVYESFIAVLRKNLVRVTELSVTTSLPGLNTRYKQELVGLKLQYANAWIQYMRFSRRSQGRMSGLVVFVKACEDEFVGWDVYEAAALLEYRTNVEDGGRVAIQTFEAGMEAFGGDASYVLSYLSFLLRINLQKNARELFERVIATFSPEEAKPIWDCWSESLYEYDNLESVLQTESRIAEIYPNDPPLKRFGRRHVYRGTDPIADHDLGFTHVKAQAANCKAFSG